MSTDKPSPGPFRIGDYGGSQASILPAGDGHGPAIAKVYLCAYRKRGRSPEHVANLHLFAASWDLLEALRGASCAVEQLCLGQDPANQCWTTLAEIRAAIAKAEGGAENVDR